ncbi:hypothetical protein DXG01_014176 [Tephrocybe rancida]|nr:hypothetical protein DXG01_014176 [Tephrocybe rancida]
MANILIDSSSKHVSAPGWISVPSPENLGGSVSRSQGSEELTSFSISFNGTAISIFIVSTLLNSSNLPSSSTITIDGNQTFDVPIPTGDVQSPSLQLEQQYFSTPVLLDATHTLSVSSFPRNFSLDYALVTPGHATPVVDELMVLDDDDLSITYSGLCNTSSYVVPVSQGQGQLSLTPLNGVTHHAQLVPDIPAFAKFNFTGTSIYIYGPLYGSQNGTEHLTMAYTLDGYKTQQDYYPASQTQANLLWFANTTMPLGLHTVQIDVLQLGGVDFVLDYVLYTPSPHAAVQAGAGLFPAPGGEGKGSAGEQNSERTKMIVIGSVVGGVVGLMLVLGIMWLWRRHNRGHQRVLSVSQDSHTPPMEEATSHREVTGAPHDQEQLLDDLVHGITQLLEPSHPHAALTSRAELVPQRKPNFRGAAAPSTPHDLSYVDIVQVGQGQTAQPHPPPSQLRRLFGGARPQTEAVTPFTVGIRPRPLQPQTQTAPQNGGERLTTHLHALQTLALDIRREMADTRAPIHTSSVPSKSSRGGGRTVHPDRTSGSGEMADTRTPIHKSSVPSKSSRGEGRTVHPDRTSGSGEMADTSVPSKSSLGEGQTVHPDQTSGSGALTEVDPPPYLFALRSPWQNKN